LLDEAYFGDVPDAADSEDEVEESTPMGKIDALRRLRGHARVAEMAKYPGDDGRFSLLKWLDVERETHKVAFVLGRRVLGDRASQSVSESTFSTHAAFTGDLRQNLGSKYLAIYVKLNRNHALFFHKIVGKIKAAYIAKYGRSGGEPAVEG
jgi:hypothetical protein